MTKSLQLIDRSMMIHRLKNYLKIDPKSTAVITIDMHRGHLDPEVATMPLPVDECIRVLSNSKRLLETARKAHVPIVHVIVVRRPIETGNPAFKEALKACDESLSPYFRIDSAGHNLEGSIQIEIMPEVFVKGDYVINNKKTFSAFYCTDLEFLLRALKVNTLILIGVNTNTCVLCTAFASVNRGYTTIVISDCVASMYGYDLHVLALENISRCLGWVLTVDELQGKLNQVEC